MKKRLFKNNVQMVIYLIIFVVCIILFIVIGKNTEKYKDSDENIKFSNIYKEVSDDNLYRFTNSQKVLEIVKGKSGVILFGFPKNELVGTYASILNDASKDVGIDELLYYDFENDRKESNGSYEKVVSLLTSYVPISDEGKQNITAPTVVMIKNGEVIGYFDIMNDIRGNITKEIYYNENVKARIYEELKLALTNYSKQV